MVEVLNGFFSSVFMRGNADIIPPAEETEMKEMADVRFSKVKVKMKKENLRTAAAAGSD
jgi:hypothetical protein